MRTVNPCWTNKEKPKTESTTTSEQILAVGPAASQIAIKQLGTNGGGFFNVNSAHPFENPTPLSNFLELLSILLIPAALCYTFGMMVGDTRQGWAILAAMTILLLVPCTARTVGRAKRQSAAGRRWAWISGRTPVKPVAIWRAKKSDSALPIRSCGRPPRPPRPMAPSTPCTIPTCR